MLTVTGRVHEQAFAPPFNPVSPYGLFSVVSMPEGMDGHWVNGVTWDHASCAAASGISGACEDESPLGLPKPFLSSQSGNITGADPFTILGTYTCSPIGSPLSRAEEYATANLLRHEQEAVEDAIWTGNLNTSPSFEGNVTDLTPTPGTAVPAPHAVGLLSAFASATYGIETPIIHAPRVAAGVLSINGLAIRIGDHYETTMGEHIALGGGYPDTSPLDGSANAAGETWLVVTPPVSLARTDVFVSPPTEKRLQGLDRDTNDLLSVAERTYVVGWDDCPLAAVLVDLQADT